ncbi:TAF13 Transcription initiation factor TFIID subunit 13 [Candida maltosa Xu316]|uniref:Transcription initiation factor TFIID subunit 13 n=1 Tax=Candida maltosa (strain Xu316) TaxID=1245528 RepID=M3HF66_CANMX|nr:hypothetical protein G210_3895 [Candida maltosa Xu316]
MSTNPSTTNGSTNDSTNIPKKTVPLGPLPPITNPKRKRKRQKLFAKDIENLLYAMGDRPVSTDATVNALEDVLVEYISQLSYSMVNFAKSQNRTRVKLNDLAFSLRNDPLKLARFRYILEQSYKIEKAKRMFDDNNDKYEDDNRGDDGELDGEEDEDEQPQQQQSEETDYSKRKSEVANDKGSKKKKRKVIGNVMLS